MMVILASILTQTLWSSASKTFITTRQMMNQLILVETKDSYVKKILLKVVKEVMLSSKEMELLVWHVLL